MPRSITRPLVGSIVWYYSAPTAVPPMAAMVTQVVDSTHLNLFVWNLDGTLTGGVAGAKPNVPFVGQGVRVTVGEFCTYIRVNQFIAGSSPAALEAHDYEEAGLTLEQRANRNARIAAEQEALVAQPMSPERAAQAKLEAEYARAAG